MVTTFVSFYLRLTAEKAYLPLCPVGLKPVGGLADLGPSYGYACLSGYTNLEWVLARQFWGLLSHLLGLLEVKHFTVFAMRKDVDYLLIAKPVAFNHLGIRRG
jgi:hypothetical protein